jgi:hypothetical protein
VCFANGVACPPPISPWFVMRLAIIHLFVSFLLFLLIVHVNFWIGFGCSRFSRMSCLDTDHRLIIIGSLTQYICVVPDYLRSNRSTQLTRKFSSDRILNTYSRLAMLLYPIPTRSRLN